MRRLVLVLWVACVAACDASPFDADGAPDASTFSPSHDPSGRIWCEDGVVYEGQLADYTRPGPAPCQVDEPGRWAYPPDPVFTCDHGCGIADAGTGCESCYGNDGGFATCHQDPSMYCAPGPDAGLSDAAL
jgi:hypothetical protein